MACKLIVLIALACVAISSSAHIARRDAPASTTAVDAYNNLEKTLGEIQATILKNIGVENTDQLKEKIKESNKKVAEVADVYLVKLKDATESLQDNEIVKDIRERAKTIEEDLKKQHPQTAADLENIGKSIQGLVNKTKDLGSTPEVQQLRGLTDKLVADLGGTFNTLFEDITKTIKAA